MPVLACCACSRRLRLQGLISPPVWNTPMCGRAMSSSSWPSACRKLRVVARMVPSRMIAERKRLGSVIGVPSPSAAVLFALGAALWFMMFSVRAARRCWLRAALEAGDQRIGAAHQEVGVQADRDKDGAEIQVLLRQR